MSYRQRTTAVLAVCLTTCLIIVGILFMPAALPDYKGAVTTFPESEQKNMLYVEQGDEIILSPWDTFNPDSCEMLSMPDMTSVYLPIYEMLEWVYILSDASDHLDSFSPAIYYDESEDMYFIKGFEYETASGETYILDFAAWGDMPVYFDCHPKNPGQETMDISELNEKLNALVRDSVSANTELPYAYGAIYDEATEDEETAHYAEDIADSNNPIDRYLLNLLGHPYFEVVYEYAISAIQSTGQPAAMAYNNQVLLALSGDVTVVLFYDPAHNQITGHSLMIR